MIISYDVTSCATPGQCIPHLMRAELRADAEFSADPAVIVGVTWTMARPDGEEIEVEYSTSLSDIQLAAALSVIEAHDGTPP